MVKMFFDLPRNTHRNLIEAVSSTSHLKIKLIKRFKKFFHTLDKCDKPHLKYLHNIQKEDIRSVYGRNAFNICRDAGATSMTTVLVENISYVPIHNDDQWRIPVVKELLEARSGRLALDLTIPEINCFLDAVLTF